MEEKIFFEHFLFGDGNEIVINDNMFCVDRILMFPQIRPLQIEKAVRLAIEYCQINEFRWNLLEKSNKCPVLIYKLYKRGVFVFEEIEPYLDGRDTFLLSIYFRKDIDDFRSFIQFKYKPIGFAQSFFENENDIDQMIEYGFIPSSIEYCLKYDSIDDLEDFNILEQEVQWSPFEWSSQPKYLDLLSFSGFFGSIKCFKHLFLQGFVINDNVTSMVVCSGCIDLYHICQREKSLSAEIISMASEFCHLSLLVFMLENGADINTKTNNF